MHRYLRSIGFGRIRSRRELNEFLSSVEKNYTCHELTALDEEADFCEYQRECGPGIGVAVCGDMDVREHFYRQYYYPYFIGSGISSYADIVVEKRMDREAYVGICEDMKVGVSLIFHLQNTVEYVRERQLAGDGDVRKTHTAGELQFRDACRPVRVRHGAPPCAQEPGGAAKKPGGVAQSDDAVKRGQKRRPDCDGEPDPG